jgi:hypothetical protein
MKITKLTGKEIKDLRLANGFRQKDCANIVGVGLRQWQKYEQGYPCKEIYIQILNMVIRNNKLIDANTHAFGGENDNDGNVLVPEMNFTVRT